MDTTPPCPKPSIQDSTSCTTEYPPQEVLTTEILLEDVTDMIVDLKRCEEKRKKLVKHIEECNKKSDEEAQ